MSGETVFHNPPTPTLKKGRWKPLKLVFFLAWSNISSMRRRWNTEKKVEGTTQWSIFDELWGVSSGDESLCRILDITSQAKWFNEEKLRMQKWPVFHLISKHSLNINFLCIFFMNYWWVWEELLKPLWSEWWSHILHFHLLKPVM